MDPPASAPPPPPEAPPSPQPPTATPPPAGSPPPSYEAALRLSAAEDTTRAPTPQGATSGAVDRDLASPSPAPAAPPPKEPQDVPEDMEEAPPAAAPPLSAAANGAPAAAGTNAPPSTAAETAPPPFGVDPQALSPQCQALMSDAKQDTEEKSSPAPAAAAAAAPKFRKCVAVPMLASPRRPRMGACSQPGCGRYALANELGGGLCVVHAEAATEQEKVAQGADRVRLSFVCTDVSVIA